MGATTWAHFSTVKEKRHPDPETGRPGYFDIRLFTAKNLEAEASAALELARHVRFDPFRGAEDYRNRQMTVPKPFSALAE